MAIRYGSTPLSVLDWCILDLPWSDTIWWSALVSSIWYHFIRNYIFILGISIK